MAATTTTNIQGMAKEIYSKVMYSTLVQKTPALDAFREAGADDGVEMGGRGLQFPVDLQWPGAAAFVSQDGNVPGAQAITEQRGSATTKECYARISNTLKSIAETRTNTQAFVSSMTRNMKRAAAELQRNVNRAIYGNKLSGNVNTGILCQVSGTQADATTCLVDNGTATHFWPGQRCLIGTAANIAAFAAAAEEVQIKSVGTLTDTTFTLTFEATAGGEMTDNDLIAMGTKTAPTWHSYNLEITGLDFITDNAGSLYGIDPATYTSWIGVKHANSGTLRTILRETMDAFGDALLDTGGVAPDIFLGHSSAVRAVQQTMDPDVRYTPVTFTGGFKRMALKWIVGDKEVPIISDMFAPLRKLYAVNFDTLKIGYTFKWDWVDEGAGAVLRVADKVNFEMIYGAILELVCFKRNAQGVLGDILINNSSISFAS